MTYSLSVDFHQDKLTLVEHNGQPYVPMKPIVENMGLAWQPQHIKLQERFKSCVTEIVMQVDGDDQRRVYTCLPLKKLFGWLMTISPNKVKPELKEKIEVYQNECDDVLWNHWSNKFHTVQMAYNKLLVDESISQAKGSFHGKGLNERKKEKRMIESAKIYLESLLQPQLTHFDKALANH